MQIIYTKHAREMMNIRNISQSLVEKCVENPEDILSAREGKDIYLKNFGKNFLRVIGVKEQGSIIVITAHWLAKK